MYFNVALAVFMSLLAAKTGADRPTYNVKFYSDKNCKTELSTAQINMNVTCSKIWQKADEKALSYLAIGPKDYEVGGVRGEATMNLYTQENCPKSGSPQVAQFGACSGGSSNLVSYDFFLYP
ncbi:hypothetical protein F5B19DRAFT_496175 [Rostrohypoxylon terebratum]|nr:hypothetical protein F5B19DRAFT_496175 [Rostrohypoxylon terebratum]